MKTVVVICDSQILGETFVSQIRHFFGESVPLLRYAVMDEFDFPPTDVLALLPGVATSKLEKIQKLINQGMEYIIARRSIDFTRLQGLMNLPKGTDVLLVNNYESAARETIEHLNRIGLDHVFYHPYAPGMRDYPRLKIAVTPGEPSLVPECVEHVVDFGDRQVDISTIVELVQRAGLMGQMGDSISALHLREIIRLLWEVNEAGRRISNMRDTLQVLADHTPNGILYSDLSGRVVLGNQTISNVLRLAPDDMVNRNIAELFPEIQSPADGLDSSTVITYSGQDLIVREKVVRRGEFPIGRLYAFETGHTIQNLEYELRRKARSTDQEARYIFEDILTRSPAMEQVLAFAKRAAPGDTTVLIQGESGTGKEMIAQAIHNASPRRSGPFVPVNFAAFPGSLLESELFGYEEGSFTGAKKGGKRGLFAEAHGGTIFLDEVGDAPLEFQVRLLRVLQERQVRPVGGRKQIPIDVRVIAASNKDLDSEIRKGAFREDLYYRLNVIPLRVPSLRERREDIPMLLNQFFRRFSQGKIAQASSVVAQDALERLHSYRWPGNIRQLINSVVYLMNIQEDHRLVEIHQLPEYIRDEATFPERRPDSRVLEQDMAWVLMQLRDHGGLGRRRLAEMAETERPHLREAMIRGILFNAESMGYAASGHGRKGSVLTDRGRRVLEGS